MIGHRNRCRIAAAGLIALVIGLLPAIAQAQTSPRPFLPARFPTQITGQPPMVVQPERALVGFETPSHSFEGACGVAIDYAGDIYVADYYHDVVDVFSRTGVYLTRIANEDPLDGPCGLAVDSSGRLYVDSYHGGLLRFAPAHYPPQFGTAYGPPAVIDPAHSTGVAVDPATGNVYVDDRSYIAEYGPFGAPVEVGGEPVRIGLGILAEGYGVAVSAYPATAGYLYATDAATDTVNIYDPSADPINPVQVIDGAGTPQAGFTDLADSALAVDRSNGHLLLLDDLQPGLESAEAVVDEFNVAGDFRGQIAHWTTHPLNSRGEEVLALTAEHWLTEAEPSGLAVDGSTADLYVTSGNSQAAGVYAFGPANPSKTLTLLTSGSGLGSVTSTPAGIACGQACKAEYNLGEEVTLSAVPAPGSAFVGFSGACSGTVACHLTLAANTEVSAEFEALPETLSVEALGAATGVPRSTPQLATSAGTVVQPSSHPHAKRHRHHRRHRRRAVRAGGRR